MIVAVDGPSGAGKSTVCRTVAERLGFTLLDTGALYRAVAFTALEHGLELSDGEALGELTRGLEIFFDTSERGEQRVFVDGLDRTQAIRAAAVSQCASIVSAHAPVRAALLEQQRTLGRRSDTIVEGRDIGTVVFPDAELKVYFTATSHARTLRRLEELAERGEEADYEQVFEAIEERDARDQNSDVAPLRQPADAILLDTSDLDFEGSCEALEELIRDRHLR